MERIRSAFSAALNFGLPASGGFTRLLFTWKGSLYKIIHFELLVFLACFYLVSLLYYFVLDDQQKRHFEQVALYCDVYMKYIPLSFILGFYLSFVVSRWWEQYDAIPWPDTLLHGIALYVQGTDEKARIVRRSMVRYLNLSLVLVLRSISSAVKQRFPTIEHLVEAGFISTAELKIFNNIPSREFNTYWIPFTWFTNLIREANVQKMITDACGTKLIMQDFFNYCEKCGLLWSYDWVSIPLVYTQVVTIATYSFFMAACIGRQFVEKSPITYKSMINLYIPLFTLLQFFFYMGLLKVAEQLINPFGDDEEDFDLNWIIDRHTKVSYLIVDTLNKETHPIIKDKFFDQDSPELLYTEATAGLKKKTYRGSVANMIVPEDKQTMVLPNLADEKYDEPESITQAISKTSTYLNVNELSHSASGRSLNQDRPSDNKAANENSIQMTPPGNLILDENNKYPSEIERLAKLKDEFSYIHLPLKSVYFDVEEGSNTPDIAMRRGSKNKNNFWMPSSLHSKLAMKNKPIVKWRPYKRPGGEAADDDVTPTELSPGEFEEESAFMWRTILDESEICGNNSNVLNQNDLSNGTINGKLMEDTNIDNKIEFIDSSMTTDVIKRSPKILPQNGET